MKQFSDPVFFKKLQSAHLATFEEFMSVYEKRIYYFILRFINNPHEAEDLTQDTFIKIYQHIGKIDAMQNLNAWVFTIAKNTVYDALRKKRRQGEILVAPDQFEETETLRNAITYHPVNIQAKYDVQKIVGHLKPIYQRVVKLFFWQNLSYKEIARQLDLPLNTVKTHLRRAKQLLRSELEIA